MNDMVLRGLIGTSFNRFLIDFMTYSLVLGRICTELLEGVYIVTVIDGKWIRIGFPITSNNLRFFLVYYSVYRIVWLDYK